MTHNKPGALESFLLVQCINRMSGFCLHLPLLCIFIIYEGRTVKTGDLMRSVRRIERKRSVGCCGRAIKGSRGMEERQKSINVRGSGRKWNMRRERQERLNRQTGWEMKESEKSESTVLCDERERRWWKEFPLWWKKWRVRGGGDKRRRRTWEATEALRSCALIIILRRRLLLLHWIRRLILSLIMFKWRVLQMLLALLSSFHMGTPSLSSFYLTTLLLSFTLFLLPVSSFRGLMSKISSVSFTPCHLPHLERSCTHKKQNGRPT